MSENLRREVSKLGDQEVAEIMEQTERDVTRTVNRALGVDDGAAPSFDSARWQARLGELLAAHHIPGATLAMLADGEIHELAAGILHTGTGVEATLDSVFQIGSVSKG
ncbi:beta-lactamase family protein [Streptomyces sp. NBC_00009]